MSCFCAVVDETVDSDAASESETRPKFVSKLTFVDLAGSERLKRTQVNSLSLPAWLGGGVHDFSAIALTAVLPCCVLCSMAARLRVLV